MDFLLLGEGNVDTNADLNDLCDVLFSSTDLEVAYTNNDGHTELTYAPVPSEEQENQDPKLGTWPSALASSCHYQGFDYTIKQRRENKVSNFWTGLYRCKHHRKGCKSALKIIARLDKNFEIIPQGAAHTCFVQPNCNVDRVIDITGEMKELTEQKALQNVKLTASEIGHQVQKEMETKYDSIPTQKLTIPQMKSLVYRSKGAEFRDWENAVQNYPLSTCSFDDERLFLQFYLTVRIGTSLEKIIGWGHPDLIFLTKYGPVNLFVDCTFKVVPKGFSQLLVLMIYSSATDMYVPIFFILLQSKHEDAYYHAIQQAICATEWKLEAKTKTCDFEQALIKALRCQFPGDEFVLCTFHWKQSLKRKLTENGIPQNLIHDLLCPGGPMEKLLVVPIDEIIPKGIPYVRSKINESNYVKKFDQFWNYFMKTWMKRYSPEEWNLNGIVQRNVQDKIVNLTNNPLERLNRALNNKFVNAHPSVPQFVDGIKEMCSEYVQKISNIQRGLDKAPAHKPVEIPTIPEDYESFIAHDRKHN
jgi:hypothetical protein